MTRSLARRASRALGMLACGLALSATAQADQWLAQPGAGGTGGGGYQDALSDGEVLSALNVCAGGQVDAIQLVSNYRNFPKRGGNGGGCQQIRFNPGEVIVALRGRADSEVTQLWIETSMGRRYGPYGQGDRGQPFELRLQRGQFGGIHGRSGRFLDQIGLIERVPEGGPGWQTPAPQPGWQGGAHPGRHEGWGAPKEFRDELPRRLRQITICGDRDVNGIQFDTEDATIRRGQMTGRCETARLDRGERIAAIFGVKGRRLQQLGLITTDGERIGPVGDGGGQEFRYDLRGQRLSQIAGTLDDRGLIDLQLGLAPDEGRGDWGGGHRPAQGPAIVGGSGGGAFVDEWSREDPIREVRICAGRSPKGDQVVAGFQLRSNGGWHAMHGRIQGNCQSWRLYPNEALTGIFGQAGQYVDQLGFITSTGRRLGPWGGNGGSPFEMSVSSRDGDGALTGRSGDVLDAVGVAETERRRRW